MGPLNQFAFCRLCLCTSDSLKDIFDAGNNDGHLVKETIEDLLEYKVIRVDGWPWLTCDSCREKLNDFRRFKISCLESKLAFENRFPQQIFLMPGIINLSTANSQQPNALLLLPIPHQPAAVNNVNTFQLSPPSLGKTVMPNCHQFVTNGNGSNAGEQHLEMEKSSSTELCETNQNLFVAKMEPVEIQSVVSSMDALHVKSGMSLDNVQLGTEVFKVAIEETDVKNVLSQESSLESSVKCEEDRTPMINGLQNRVLISRNNVSLTKKTESVTVRTEKLPMPITMDEESSIELSKKEDLIQELSGEQINCDSPALLVSQVQSFSSVERVKAESIIATPDDKQGETDPPSTIEGGIDMKPVSNSPNNLKTIYMCSVGEATICNFGDSFPKSLSNPNSDSQGITHSECSLKNHPQLTVSWKHQHKDTMLGLDMGHTESRGSKPYECLMCFKKFNRHDHLASHKLSHAGNPKPFKCPMCPRTYRNRKNQLQHHKTHYNVPQRFECEVCKAGFKFQHHLKRHVSSHTVKDNYPCKICGQVFKARHLHVRHVAKHNGPKFPCSTCDKAFFLKSQLTGHQLTHNNKKSYRCNICGKGFNKPQYLRCHLQLHDKVKRHTCKECGAKFAQYSALWQHRKWHQGNKKFVCEVCNKGFVLNCQLRQHQKIHTKTSKKVGEKASAKTLNGADENINTADAKELDGQQENL